MLTIDLTNRAAPVLGTPEDIANLAAYLLSPSGDCICNQAILVDGGRMIF